MSDLPQPSLQAKSAQFDIIPSNALTGSTTTPVIAR